MSTDSTDVSASSLKSCGSDRMGNTNVWFLSQPNTRQAPLSIESNIMDLLNTRLSPDQLQTNYHKLELLKKSSFYIVVIRQDVPQLGNQHYISNSTLMHFIDISRFQRVKRDGNNQVKLQLALLEMLYAELTRGREELQDILAQKSGPSLLLRDAEIQEKILRLHQVADDFDAAMIPGKLHVKHSLIPELESKRLPKFQLVLEAEKPVMFNREQTQAFCDSVVLHWYIAEQEQHKPDEEFEIHYKLINPTNETEAREFGSLACSSYVIKLTDLRPDRSYEFSVKRLDIAGLVYGVWKDSIVLTTTSPHTSV
ncbi:fibronectin type III domain-containing protein 11 [Pangasianodon hypophthalmus]|uniref:fibronectin type III domain-containing protein 11 n=1 Tax=Pangasianodon hypophthalmus TaxID=310915 RepID=UPI001480515C|nr:fibronectin type III domain-containing protein 11 [Pangasianodon hypophthalmus]